MGLRARRGVGRGCGISFAYTSTRDKVARYAVPESNILLVDDNVAFRSTLAMVLEAEGIQARQAGRGDEALELLRREFTVMAPELLVLDLNLPDTTGVGLYLEIVREMPGARCIFMTAEASQVLIDKALELNPLKLLRKPFEIQLFRDLVRGALLN
jgi:DNA-binding response OmpR family regulator